MSAMINWNKGQTLTLFLLSLIIQIQGHGRLMEPPNRSSLWRLKEFEEYLPEKNYDDNQLWCGGMGSQYNLSGGKCGPCGDEYVKPRPRDNENGGKYGRGIITRKYNAAETIPIGVELTVNHLGYFLFSLCPIQRTPSEPVTPEDEECFDLYPLPLADGSGTKFLVKSKETRNFKTFVSLPKDVTCKMCVLRWHYRTGNRWNYVNNQTGALGIGDQEIFRGCSDITIGSFPTMATTTARTTTIAATMTTTARLTPTTIVATTTMTTTPRTSTTSVEPSSQIPPVKPIRPIPTLRPPQAITTAEPPKTTTATPQKTTTVSPNVTTVGNSHSHPVMHPPLPSSKEPPPKTVIFSPLLDSLSNSL